VLPALPVALLAASGRLRESPRRLDDPRPVIFERSLGDRVWQDETHNSIFSLCLSSSLRFVHEGR